jgi:hypothetical protein
MKESHQMLGNKEIIVVAPKDYKSLARALSHQISKIQGCNGAFWTIEQYEQNEFQMGGIRYVILIGNPDENGLTKDFLPVIDTLHNRAGACFGYDGAKAVVFGEGKLEQEEAFQGVLATSAGMVAGAAGAAAASTSLTLGVGAFLAAATTIALPIVPIGLALGGAFGYLGGLVKRAWRTSAAEKKLRQEQTKLALTLFLAECFDTWIGIKKPE